MKRFIQANHTFIYIAGLIYFFLFPLFFLPTTINFFETNKLLLTVIMAAVCFIAWGLDVIGRRSIRLTFTPFTLPLTLVGLSVIVSLFFSGSNRLEALLGRGAFIPALVVIALLLPTLIEAKAFVRRALYALIASASILSLISITQSLGFGLSQILNRLLKISLPNTLAFTPAGSPLALIVFLTVIILTTIVLAMTYRHLAGRLVLFFAAAVMGAGLILLLFYSWPGKDTAPVFLPLEHGYAITLEALKNPKTALVGVGPEAYVVAYNQTRPARLNLTPLWNIRFTNASNELFQTITTLGVIGLVAWVLVTIAAFKTAKIPATQALGKVIKFGSITLLLMLLLVPGTYLYLFTLFMFLTLWSVYLKLYHREEVKNVDARLTGISLVREGHAGPREQTLSLLPYLVALPALVIGAALIYFPLQAYQAELTFKKALDALAKNQGVETYDLERLAITQNPYVTQYRRAYAATNLALANSIAGKENLTDEDRQNITQLIQQAIREGKAAVSLDPQNAVNWENLTTIYKSLINVAQNADSWTVAALAQAIRNDPLNPRLRLELGGIYYSLNQYDQAIRFYQQAAELKPDWANAYYNLAAAHRQKKEAALAYDYLVTAIRYLDPASADYAKVQGELQELADELNLKAADQAQVPPPQGDLVVPTQAPTPNPTQAVNLNQESALEGNADTLPTPAPNPSPTIQP